MVAIQDRLFADRHPPQPRQDRGGSIQHIGDVLEELFERFLLPPSETKLLEIKEPVVV